MQYHGNSENKLVGSFNKDSQADSVPIALMTLMSMLVDGTTTENVLSQGALTSEQVAIYNVRKKSMKTNTGNRRHAKSRENHWSHTTV